MCYTSNRSNRRVCFTMYMMDVLSNHILIQEHSLLFLVFNLVDRCNTIYKDSWYLFYKCTKLNYSIHVFYNFMPRIIISSNIFNISTRNYKLYCFSHKCNANNYLLPYVFMYSN